MHYRYKKLQETHPKTFGHENIRLFFESVYLKILLELELIEPENVDEFSLNTRKKAYKGWIKMRAHIFEENYWGLISLVLNFYA